MNTTERDAMRTAFRNQFNIPPEDELRIEEITSRQISPHVIEITSHSDPDYPPLPVEEEDAAHAAHMAKLQPGFYTIEDFVKYAGDKDEPPVNPIDVSPVRDASEPIVILPFGNTNYPHQMLQLDERYAHHEIGYWYKMHAVRQMPEAMQKEFLSWDFADKRVHHEVENNLFGNQGVRPVVFCFPAEELVRKFKAAGWPATWLPSPFPDSREELHEAARMALPPIDIGYSDMPEAVLDGRLGQICADRMSSFPRAYAWPALLAMASVLVPKETSARTNLYVCLVGNPGTGKSQAFDNAARLLSLMDNPHVLHLKSGSAEGLAERLGEVNGETRLLFPDELGHLLQKAQIEGASFTYVLNDAFYKDECEMTVARRKVLNFKVRLSVAGGVVSDRFDEAFGKETTGGLYDRFIFGQCPAGGQFLYRPFEGEPAYQPHPLDEDALSEYPCAVTIDAGVYRVRDEWTKLDIGITPRMAELAVRAAIICASFDGRRELRPEDLGAAFALAQYQARVRRLLKPNVGETDEAILAERFLNYLKAKANDGRWIRVRTLYHSCHAREKGLSIADRALKALDFNRYIEMGTEGSQRARVVRWLGDAYDLA